MRSKVLIKVTFINVEEQCVKYRILDRTTGREIGVNTRSYRDLVSVVKNQYIPLLYAPCVEEWAVQNGYRLVRNSERVADKWADGCSWSATSPPVLEFREWAEEQVNKHGVRYAHTSY